jgi:hypothetical protein
MVSVIKKRAAVIRTIVQPGPTAAARGEIDLDAGNDPDEWSVYLFGIPRFKKA